MTMVRGNVSLVDLAENQWEPIGLEVALWRPPKGWRPIRWERDVIEGNPYASLVVWMDRENPFCIGALSCCGRLVWAYPILHPIDVERSGVSWSDFVSKWIQRQVERTGKKADALSEAGQKWVEAHEALWEYMTCDEMPDGGERMTSMLVILTENGMVKAALQDRQEGLSLWAAAQSVPEVLDALEARLRAGDGDWRPMRGQQPNRVRNNRR